MEMGRTMIETLEGGSVTNLYKIDGLYLVGTVYESGLTRGTIYTNEQEARDHLARATAYMLEYCDRFGSE